MAEVVKPAREVFVVPGQDPAVGMEAHENVAVDPAVVRVLKPLPERVAYRVETQKLSGLMDEAFILADNLVEARFVDQRLNDDQTRSAKRRRLRHLSQHGEVNEVLMPDTVEAIRAELVWRETRERWRKVREQLENAAGSSEPTGADEA